MNGYRATDVSRLLDLPVDDVRRLARAGLASPGQGRERLFSFRDLVLLRSAAALVRAGIPRTRVCRTLRALREQVPHGRSVAAIRMSAHGDRVVAQAGGARWHPDSGQTLLDLDPRAHAREPVFAARAAAATASDAERWCRRGEALEETSLPDAEEAYRRALAVDPGHGIANLNLGRILHERGDLETAERHYRNAEGSAEHCALAAYNLGVVLEDRGILGEALEGYRRALEADPALADAHFNASRLLERCGRRPDALRHLAEYRRLSKAARSPTSTAGR